MNDNQIVKVSDLVEFLKTLNQDATISAENIHIVGSTYVDIKEMPVLKSLFVPDGEKSYKIKAMFY